jgi:ABC-type enterochelin transport system permease subunit
MFGFEALYRFFDRCEIFFVDEVSTVAATTLLQFGCVVIKYAFAARAVDAGPVGEHKCRIDHPCLLGVWVGETNPLVKFFWS